MHMAADGGHLLICQILAEHGLSVDTPAANGCTPLHRAASMGHLDVTGFFVSGKSVRPPLPFLGSAVLF